MPRYSETPLVPGASWPITVPDVVFTGAPIWKPPVGDGFDELEDEDLAELDEALDALDEALAELVDL